VTGPEDFASIGFTELLEQGGVVAVEWPERVADLLPANVIHICIIPTGESLRQIDISGDVSDTD